MKVKFLSIIFFLISLSQVLAQDFEVAPVTLYFNANPGESQSKVVTIKNHSSEKKSFILSSTDFEITTDGEKRYRPANSTKNSIASWLSISPAFFDLEPNAERQVTVSVQPPTDDDGSRWGAIFVRTTEEKTTFESDAKLSAGITISPRIAIQVYQTAKSNKNLKAKIDQLREIPSEDSTERWFSAIVTNLSDIIIHCKVFLIASNMQTAKEHQYPPVQFDSYPKNTQKIILKMPKGLPKGTYALAAVLDYGSNVNLEGTQMVIQVPK
ncbi:fimbrial biogenesis chaperone [Salinivirga cyanobacteriivorans]